MAKQYPLHPGQIHAEPYYCTIPLEEYESMKKRIAKLEKDNAALEIANKNLAESVAKLNEMKSKEYELDMRERELDEREKLKTITIFGSGGLNVTDKANIISPKNYSWTPSEKEVPNDNRTVFVVKDRCHFIGFYEGGKFWLSSQDGAPINKRLKRTEIKQPLHWIDYPEDNSP